MAPNTVKAYMRHLEDAFLFSKCKPLSLAGDSFPKIIVRGDIRRRWYDDGVLNIGIVDFLLDDSLV